MTTTEQTNIILVGLVGTILGIILAIIIPVDDVPPTIGTRTVPVLHCQEDEVIGFDQSGEIVPAPLMCIHIDDLRGIAPLSADAAAQGREEDAYDMGYQDGLAAN